MEQSILDTAHKPPISFVWQLHALLDYFFIFTGYTYTGKQAHQHMSMRYGIASMSH